MTTTRISPPLRRQRLGRILRDLRGREQLTLEQVGQRLGWSRAKLARIEAGQHKPALEDVAAAMELYRAPADLRDLCMTLTRQSAARPWWTPYKRVLGQYVALETEATWIRSWQPMLVEGLLQTPDYTRAVVRADLPSATASEVDLRVRARMARQQLLAADDPLHLTVVLHEDALRIPVGTEATMRGQLTHLAEMAELPHVTVQVLPRRVGAHPGMSGGFVLLSIPDDPIIVFVEGGPEEVISKRDDQVRIYTTRFGLLAATAHSPEESMHVLRAIAREFDAC